MRWGARVRRVVGDSTYGTKENIAAVEKASIGAYLSTTDFEKKSPYYGSSRFVYEPERDLYRCPQGEPLRLYTHSYTERVTKYRAQSQACNACPSKPECTPGNNGRVVRRSFDEGFLERVLAYRETEPYKKALRKRKVWVEPMFAKAKEWHGMRRFRLKEALAGESRGYGDRRGPKRKAAAHVLGQGTEEVGAGSGPAASGTDLSSAVGTLDEPSHRRSQRIPREFFNTLTPSTMLGE